MLLCQKFACASFCLASLRSTADTAANRLLRGGKKTPHNAGQQATDWLIIQIFPG